MRFILTLFVLSISILKSGANNPNAPFNLRTCDKVNPIGTAQIPFFAWYTSDPDHNEVQTAYQILVASSPELLKIGKADIWDSGKQYSRLQNYINFNGKPLSAAKRYYWKVRTWDKDGNSSPYAQPSYFDTGLFTAADWKGASWIRRDTKDPNVYTYFRKQLSISAKPVKRAIVYVSAYHNYELFINGTPVGKGLAYHYPQYAFYNAFEVTTILKDYNTISAMTHWYGGGQGRPKGDSRFILKLIVTYVDGSEAIFGTDKTWKQTAVAAFNPKTKNRNGEGVGFIDIVAAMQIMGDRALNHRVLLQFLDSQDQYWPDGQLNAVYPNVDGKRDIPDFTQQYLLWVWDYYLQTGNIEFLKTNYAKLKKVANYVATYTNPNTGLIHDLAGGSGPYKNGIIDWPDHMRYGYDMSTSARTVINAYAYADFEIVSKIAAILGNQADTELFRTKAEAISKAINSKLINSNGVYIDGLLADGSQSKHVSQHANMFPIALGIVPTANKKAVVATIKERQMSVGMVTLRFLPQALGMTDEAQQLLELYTNPNWDGWAKNITLGATATWESWNALERNDSMSHPWGTSGLDGIQRFILGLTIIKPQHELIAIKPLDFHGKLNSAAGTIPTDKGDIQIAWQRNTKSYQLNFNSPTNVTANVYLPKSGATSNQVLVNGKLVAAKTQGNYFYIENVGSGKHTFIIKL